MIDVQIFQLQTERVMLRPIEASDLDALFAVYADPEVMRYTSDPPFTDRAMMAQFFESIQYGYHSGEYYELALVSLPDTVIGTCSLHSFNAEQASAEVGFILHRAYWRRGLMSEALRVLLNYSFTQLQLRVIYADVDVPNAASRALITRLGFQPVADHATLFALTPPLL